GPRLAPGAKTYRAWAAGAERDGVRRTGWRRPSDEPQKSSQASSTGAMPTALGGHVETMPTQSRGHGTLFSIDSSARSRQAPLAERLVGAAGPDGFAVRREADA